jgi:hypothetical protein
MLPAGKVIDMLHSSHLFGRFLIVWKPRDGRSCLELGLYHLCPRDDGRNVVATPF